jgi:hypothetical protein
MKFANIKHGQSQTGNKYSAYATTFIDNQLSINAPALGLAAGKYIMILLKVF